MKPMVLSIALSGHNHGLRKKGIHDIREECIVIDTAATLSGKGYSFGRMIHMYD